MATPFSNQATPKYLGYVYQVLVALEVCFDAKKNGVVWIECFGDIYDGETHIEVKHHLTGGALSSNNIDFWKTLKNLLVEDTEDMEAFILHTTQNIPEGSIFYDWNDLSKTKKYQLLKKHVPSDTAKPYYDKVLAAERKAVLEILGGFRIVSSKEKVDKFWMNLLDHRHLAQTDKMFREDAINWLYGYMNKKAMDDPYRWCIDINDFDSDYLEYSKKFKTGNIPFPYVEEDEVNVDPSQTFKFINELEGIGLKEKAKFGAVSDYLRSYLSESKLITKKPDLMTSSIKRFENDLLRKCSKIKESGAANLNVSDANTDVAKTSSVNAYHVLQNSDALNIEHVDDTDPYFTTGKALSSVEQGKFSWVYSEDDLK